MMLWFGNIFSGLAAVVIEFIAGEQEDQFWPYFSLEQIREFSLSPENCVDLALEMEGFSEHSEVNVILFLFSVA